MKIFGIGFSGYIGEAVAAKLLADEHTLTGLARSETAKITVKDIRNPGSERMGVYPQRSE